MDFNNMVGKITTPVKQKMQSGFKKMQQKQCDWPAISAVCLLIGLGLSTASFQVFHSKGGYVLSKATPKPTEIKQVEQIKIIPALKPSYSDSQYKRQ